MKVNQLPHHTWEIIRIHIYIAHMGVYPVCIILEYRVSNLQNVESQNVEFRTRLVE